MSINKTQELNLSNTQLDMLGVLIFNTFAYDDNSGIYAMEQKSQVVTLDGRAMAHIEGFFDLREVARQLVPQIIKYNVLKQSEA